MLASSTATVVDSSRAAGLADQHAQHVGMFGKIVVARAVSARDHAHRRQGAELAASVAAMAAPVGVVSSRLGPRA